MKHLLGSQNTGLRKKGCVGKILKISKQLEQYKILPEKVKMSCEESPSSNGKLGAHQLGAPTPIVPYQGEFHVPDQKTLTYIPV